jgi:hypothetical protein
MRKVIPKRNDSKSNKTLVPRITGASAYEREGVTYAPSIVSKAKDNTTTPGIIGRCISILRHNHMLQRDRIWDYILSL